MDPHTDPLIDQGNPSFEEQGTILDIVPSSSEDITRVMRGEPKPKLPEKKWREPHFI